MLENEMPLHDFINLPTTVGLIVPTTPLLNEVVRERPYIKLGKNLGRTSIVYTSNNHIVEVATLFSLSRIYTLPHVLGLLGEADLEASGITQVQNQPYLDLHGSNVLLGFVDTGIDYTNEAFRYEDGSTRVQYIWDQTLSGNAPSGYFFGSEYDAEELNRALQSDNPQEIVPHEDRVGHGTFLASVAGGKTKEEVLGAAINSEFIVVKVKKASQYFIDSYLVPKEQENVYESTDLMLGIQYLLDKAAQLGRPISICIGMGTNFGGHDGLSSFDEYIDMVGRKTGVCICVAAGNESQANHHASGKLSEQEKTQNIDINLEVPSSGFITTIISNSPDRISVSLVSPNGEVVGPVQIKEQTIFEAKLILERVTVNIQYYFPIEVSGAQLTVIKLFNPTAGLWRIIVHGDVILDGTYHAWLPITGLITPGVSFVQADPYVTIVNPSAAAGCIACGAYNSRDGTLYINSSWGPTRISLAAPDLVAPGVNVRGIYPTGVGEMSGTSVASAMTAGASALMLEWGIVQNNDPILNTSRIKSYLIRGCTREPSTIYPNYQWGYGMLNLYQAFTMLRPN